MNIASAKYSKQIREALTEHNVLNGFVFVVVEFFLVMLAALFIAWSGVVQSNIIIVIIGVGVASNALAVCLTALRQLRNKEHDEGIMKIWSSSVRRRIISEHPGLGRRTFVIVITIVVPFLLTFMLICK